MKKCKHLSESYTKECMNCTRVKQCYHGKTDNYVADDSSKKKTTKKTSKKKYNHSNVRDNIRKIGNNVDKFLFSKKCFSTGHACTYYLKFKNLVIEAGLDFTTKRGYCNTTLHIADENVPLKDKEKDFLEEIVEEKRMQLRSKELIEKNKKNKEDFKEGTKSLNLIKFN